MRICAHFPRAEDRLALQTTVKNFCAACSGTIIIAGAAAAETPTPLPSKPVVVEMFLSQSCKSSPPAAEMLSALGGRSDLLVLAYHVPYWDGMPAHNRGAWADPFAQPEFAERQKLYNVRMRRTDMVYTPQAVIDGVFHAVGSKRETLDARIVEAQFLDEHSRPLPPVLDLVRGRDGTIRVRIDRVGAPYDAYAVSFRPQARTEIEGGDNAGSTFDEVNVVTRVEPLLSGAQGAQSTMFAAPANGDDCAVLVQERGQGRVVAARYCADRLTN